VRIRTIKPEFFRDPDTTGRWPADLKVFYIGMWLVADDKGRFVWDEDLIAADLFPFDRKADVGHLLARLVAAGVVRQYEADGRKYGHIKNFAAHQRINNPTASKLPDPDASPTGVLPESYVSPTVGLTPGKEGKGREGIKGEECSEPSSPPSPAVALLPCVGKGPSEYAVTQAEVDGWAPAYPGVDVLVEVLKAKAWLESNPTKRKTHAGIPRFLVSWLGRAQDAPKRGGTKPLVFAPASKHTQSGEIAL
jgi:hypothetical protein